MIVEMGQLEIFGSSYQVTKFLQKLKPLTLELIMVPLVGFEPTTCGMQGSCTNHSASHIPTY